MAIPLAALLPAITTTIGAGLSWATGRSNRKTQAKENQRNRDFEVMMADRKTNFDYQNWVRQNEYNHPAQQMQRLREAGLNPNLVYGKGADNTAGAVASTNYSASNQEAPQMSDNFAGIVSNLGESLLMGKKITAETDNLYAQNAVLQQEAALKTAQTATTLQQNAKSKFDLEQAQSLKDLTVEKAKLQNEQLKADIKFKLNENDRRELLTSSNIQKTLVEISYRKQQQLLVQLQQSKTAAETARIREEILNLQETRKKIETSNQILQEDLKLRKQGITPNDPMWMRLLLEGIEGTEATSPPTPESIGPENTKSILEKLQHTPSIYKKK